jgi:hypothetical protein
MSKLMIAVGLCLGSIVGLASAVSAQDVPGSTQMTPLASPVSIEHYGPFNKASATDFSNDLRRKGLNVAVEQDPSGAYWVYVY